MEESLYRKGKYKHMENGEVEMNECMENEIMQQDLEMLVDSDLPITCDRCDRIDWFADGIFACML